MSKAVYWMFVGALFKDSAPKVLKHYRPYVKQLEEEAEGLAKQQIEEEKNKQYFVENQEQLEEEYQDLIATRMTSSSSNDMFRGGSSSQEGDDIMDNNDRWRMRQLQKIRNWTNQTRERLFAPATPEEIELRRIHREAQAKLKAKERALKEAAKVAIDYRPVMSRIINDYLF
ncbi:MAG: hypothetical protein SGARI_007765, partial [Bacillariaceae sp.]